MIKWNQKTSGNDKRIVHIRNGNVIKGCYISQNYDVPQMEKPQEIIYKFKFWINNLDQQFRKDLF